MIYSHPCRWRFAPWPQELGFAPPPLQNYVVKFVFISVNYSQLEHGKNLKQFTVVIGVENERDHFVGPSEEGRVSV